MASPSLGQSIRRLFEGLSSIGHSRSVVSNQCSNRSCFMVAAGTSGVIKAGYHIFLRPETNLHVKEMNKSKQSLLDAFSFERPSTA